MFPSFNKNKRDLYDLTMKSLTENPGDWYKSYSCVRNKKLNIEIWANSRTGLQVRQYNSKHKVGDIYVSVTDRHPNLLCEIGWVTMASTMFAGLIPWRNTMWKLLKNIPDSTHSSTFEPPIDFTEVNYKGA